MYNIEDFKLYEELLSFFELEGNELLAKLYVKLPAISRSYDSMDCFVSCPSGDVLVIMNNYQKQIDEMFKILLRLWLRRN